jgi:hypothetical protein
VNTRILAKKMSRKYIFFEIIMRFFFIFFMLLFNFLLFQAPTAYEHS